MSGTSGIKAVLFDKDGTLIDFDATWGPTFHALIVQLAKGDETRMRRLSAAGGYDFDTRAFRPDSILVAGSNDDVVEAFAEILEHADPVSLAEEINAGIGALSLPHLSAFPDLEATLGRLRDMGLVLGVATNDSEASARTQIKALGLDGHFSSILGFDSGHGAKPGPGMVTAFCAAHGLMPGEVVMVGDSLHDIHAGRAAGAHALGVATGPRGAAAFGDDADHVVTDLREVVEWIAARG